VKLIAEPWDVGPGGYQVGNFPVGWAEWNDHYRDTVRRFWRGDPGQVGELATRLSGSSDIFAPSARQPHSSINFVASHDGFTLHDLVSYEHKHNEANGEDNRDGTDENLSRNWGQEGPIESVTIVRMRERIKRNFLATLACSQGVPMLCAGDEMGRTQRGNNNAYCQDNEISWVDWALDERRRELLAFTRKVFAIRAANPTLRRRRWFRGDAVPGIKDVTWLRPDGAEMTDDDWRDGGSHVLGMLFSGGGTDDRDERGRPVRGDTLLLLVNGGTRSRYFALPRVESAGEWLEEINTARVDGTRVLKAAGVNLVAHSLVVLRRGAP
jgi:glycogen operon protein